MATASMRAWTGGLLLSFASVAATAAPIRVASPVFYPTGNYLSQIALGDFTHDGNLDLAAVTSVSGGLAILPGSGTGAFGAPQDIGTMYYIAKVITTADLNGDGLSDLVLAGSHNVVGGTPFGLQSFLGQPDGSFNALPYAVLHYSVRTIIAGSFSGATTPDLAMTAQSSTGAGGVLLSPGGGGGAFGAGQFISLPTTTPGTLVAGDFNGDGKTDLAVTDEGNSRLFVLLGHGDGTFDAPATVTLPGPASAIAAADLNGDGKTDLVAAGGVSVYSLLGNGDGTFQAPMTFAAGKLPRSIVAVDLNCDGKVDVATANYNGPGVSLLQGNGDGTFGKPKLLRAGVEPVAIVAGDLDHDGRPDLVVANYISMKVSVYMNQSRGCGR